MNWDVSGLELARLMSRAMTLESSSSSAASKVGSFANCAARFDGSSSKLKSFILSITLYKDVEGVNDRTALQELSLLLEGEAATWWAEVKEEVYIWSEALRLLQLKFMAKYHAHEIYYKIFSVKQDEYVSTEIFIKQKQDLFYQLPRPHSEEAQIDMIYSLLRPKIQMKVPRQSIVTFDQLIEAARRLEHKKYKKRVRRFERFDLKSMMPAGRLRKCSHYRETDEDGNYLEVLCDLCRQERRKRIETSRLYTPSIAKNTHIPLSGFNPDSNPFNK